MTCSQKMVLIGYWGAVHPWVRITGGRGDGDGYGEGREQMEEASES